MTKSDLYWLTERPIAHRGYHDLALGRAENSMSAFAAAVEAGYAIECDVQVSKSGEPVVFHDPTLARMTGVEGKVRDYSPGQLAELRLAKTRDGIHTLKEHLDLVAGQVPVVIELKGVEGADAGFVEGVAETLQGYDGQACVMSFDHWICDQFRTLMPDVPRGLTAEGGDETHDTHSQAMEKFDLQFVSYSLEHLPCQFVKQARENTIPVISWTIKSPADA